MGEKILSNVDDGFSPKTYLLLRTKCVA